MRRGEVADRMRGQVPGWVSYPPRPPGQLGAHWCERSTRSLGSGWWETRPPKQVAHVVLRKHTEWCGSATGSKASVPPSSHLILPSKGAPPSYVFVFNKATSINQSHLPRHSLLLPSITQSQVASKLEEDEVTERV